MAERRARVRETGSSSTVDASPARRHLLALAAAGVGYRTAAASCGVSASTVRGVRAGGILRVSPGVLARLLDARPVLAHGALVKATATWRSVDSLEREGYTRRSLAFALGLHCQQLQLGRKRIRVRSALRMARLYAQLAA